MINLRFHIVSIVAIFLALAIGMFAGSTLLDRATIDVLQGRQRSLDSRNSRLRAQNDELRASVDRLDTTVDAFGESPMDALLPGLLPDEPILIIAVRGIDEPSVRAAQDAMRTAGAAPLGIVWLDDGADLDDPDALAAMALALGLEGEAGTTTKSTVVNALSRGLGEAASPTTTAPGDVVEPSPATDELLSQMSRLADAGIVEWESPTEGEPGSRVLPAGGLQVVFVSGEGATLPPGRFVYPLIRALSARIAGVVVAEIRIPRAELDAVDDPDVPPPGEFVDPLRIDGELSSRLITIDGLDEPFGRLALVLALAGLPDTTSGAYGTAATASSPFPTQE